MFLCKVCPERNNAFQVNLYRQRDLLLKYLFGGVTFLAYLLVDKRLPRIGICSVTRTVLLENRYLLSGKKIVLLEIRHLFDRHYTFLGKWYLFGEQTYPLEICYLFDEQKRHSLKKKYPFGEHSLLEKSRKGLLEGKNRYYRKLSRWLLLNRNK